MADVEVSYKGSTIGSLSASGTLTLETQGKYCEDDIGISYTSPGGGGGAGDVYIVDAIVDNKSVAAIEIPIDMTAHDNYAVSYAVIATGVYSGGVLTMDDTPTIPSGNNLPMHGVNMNVEYTAMFSGKWGTTSVTDQYFTAANCVVRASLSPYSGVKILKKNDSTMQVQSQYNFGKAGYYFKYRIYIYAWDNGTPTTLSTITYA